MQVVSYAVVRDDPPTVFVADDEDTLQWVLALRLVADTNPALLPSGAVEDLREALLEERWGDAVSIWMERMGVVVDVYPSQEFYEAGDVEFAAAELQFTPLFRE